MENPIVYIKPKAKQKLDLYLALCKYEISGIGEVAQIGTNFLIEDLFLFKQEVHSTGTKISQDDIAKFITESVRRGGDPSKLKLWFHSHVNLDAYWSGTDDATIETFGSDYLISIVGNKKGEYRTRIDIYKPIRLAADNLNLKIHTKDCQDELVKEIEDEIEEKVVYVAPYRNRGRGRGVRYTYQERDDGTCIVIPMVSDDGYSADGNQTDLALTYDEEEIIIPCDACEKQNCHDCKEEFDWVGV
jgi:proteasome lid subunit RPN8/RPN11